MSATTNSFGPRELLYANMEQLPAADIVRCRQVCRSWKAAVDAPSATMKVTLHMTSSTPVLDTWTENIIGGGVWEQLFVLGIINTDQTTVLESLADSQEVVQGNLDQSPFKQTWFGTSIPLTSWCLGAKNDTTHDLRREMLICEPPVNFIQVRERYHYHGEETDSWYSGGPDKIHDVVQPGGVQLKHILGIFEEGGDGEGWSGLKDQRSIRVGLFQ